MHFVSGIITFWLLLCALQDWRQQRIGNLLTYGMIAVALLFTLVRGQTLGGLPQLAAWLGAGLALLLTLPGFLRGSLGGGDVKLLAGLGLAAGPQVLLACFLASVPVLLLQAGLLRRGHRRQPLAPALLAGWIISSLLALPARLF